MVITKTVKESINALTGIRIVAACYVLFYHVGIFLIEPFFPAVYYYYKFVFSAGWMGVDLFFILSGFIISYNYHEIFQQPRLHQYGDFLIKRLARIYPVHLFCLIIVFVFIVYRFSDGSWIDNDIVGSRIHELNDVSLIALFKNIFLIHAWIPPLQMTWNFVSWSVSCEWLAYIFFPLIVVLLSPFKQRRSLWVVLATIYFITLVIVFALVSEGLLLTYSALIRIFSEFSMGVVLYKIYALAPLGSGEKARWRRNMIVGLCVMGMLLSWYPLSYTWVILIFLWIIYAIARGHVEIKILSSAAFVLGGKISYSLYMVHGMMFVLYILLFDPAHYVDDSSLFKVLYIASYLLITALVTLFSYYYVEEPSRKLIVRRWVQ